MKAKVFVTLKTGVLDPAGQAVVHGLHSLGYEDVQDVRIGKFFEIELAGGSDAEERLRSMSAQLLANPVIEDFRVELESGE